MVVAVQVNDTPLCNPLALEAEREVLLSWVMRVLYAQRARAVYAYLVVVSIP